MTFFNSNSEKFYKRAFNLSPITRGRRKICVVRFREDAFHLVCRAFDNQPDIAMSCPCAGIPQFFQCYADLHRVQPDTTAEAGDDLAGGDVSPLFVIDGVAVVHQDQFACGLGVSKRRFARFNSSISWSLYQ